MNAAGILAAAALAVVVYDVAMARAASLVHLAIGLVAVAVLVLAFG